MTDDPSAPLHNRQADPCVTLPPNDLDATLPPVEAGDGPTLTGDGTNETRRLPPGPLDGIPRYEVERELGRGGMGIVYLARQTKLNRLSPLRWSGSAGTRVRFST